MANMKSAVAVFLLFNVFFVCVAEVTKTFEDKSSVILSPYGPVETGLLTSSRACATSRVWEVSRDGVTPTRISAFERSATGTFWYRYDGTQTERLKYLQAMRSRVILQVDNRSNVASLLFFHRRGNGSGSPKFSFKVADMPDGSAVALMDDGNDTVKYWNGGKTAKLAWTLSDNTGDGAAIEMGAEDFCVTVTVTWNPVMQGFDFWDAESDSIALSFDAAQRSSFKICRVPMCPPEDPPAEPPAEETEAPVAETEAPEVDPPVEDPPTTDPVAAAWLEHHNNPYRREVQVRDVVWDEAVAENARKWAKVLQEQNACGLDHSSNSFRTLPELGYLGENLYYKELWSSRDFPAVNNGPLDASKSWGDEKDEYRFGPLDAPCTYRTGKQIGHYTAMTWAGTGKIGCASVQCKRFEDGWYKTRELSVCQYAKAEDCTSSCSSNTIGHFPYCGQNRPLTTTGTRVPLCSNSYANSGC